MAMPFEAFILELGTGFAFLVCQKRIHVGSARVSA